MLSKKLEAALNEQIKHEKYSAYMYLAMSAQCEEANMKGFARWLRVQAQEELSHALRIFDYINERGGRVRLQAIDEPPMEYGTPLQMFEKVYEHEQKVTGFINALYDLARSENDYPTQIHLNWFIEEQVEEEASASEIVETLKMIGEKGHALVMLDRELGKRGE